MPEREKDKKKNPLDELMETFTELLPEMLTNYEGHWVAFGPGDKEPLGGYWHCEEDAKKVAYLKYGPNDDSFIVREVSRKHLAQGLKSQDQALKGPLLYKP